MNKNTWDLDHFPIKFELKINSSIYRKITNRISTKKIDWAEYKRIMMRKEFEIEQEWLGISDKEEKYEKLKNVMIEAVSKASGKVKRRQRKTNDNFTSNLGRRKRNPVSWWDKECDETVGNRKKCLHRVLRDKTLENWIEYRKVKAMVRKVTRKKRRENLKEFAEKLNKNFSLKYVWNKMKVLKNRDSTQEWNKWGCR